MEDKPQETMKKCKKCGTWLMEGNICYSCKYKKVSPWSRLGYKRTKIGY